ncbi:MAG: DUF3795 domain-containing protein [Candidatus Delongbacteria bacterium]|nr:DUF3795 domain-containing protein [Candidatus Delongbacteria bacterium]
MDYSNSDKLIPDKTLAAVCGLFCPACSLYIGTHHAPQRLEAMAAQMGRPVEELYCDGCRSERRSFYCRTMCGFKACAAEKGVEFCGECPDYPCQTLMNFQSQMPHRLELWDNLAMIRKEGLDAWYSKMVDHYRCPECGALNSAYDLLCPECRHDPGNEFTARHSAEIRRHLGLSR